MASSTTGLSKNLTPLLSSGSLLVLVLLRVAGKIGPLLALQALFRSRLGADDFLERIESGRVLTV